MKYCARCKTEKPTDQFRKSKIRSDGLQTFCSPCNTEYQREWYAKNREAHIRNTVRTRTAKTETARKFVVEYLSTHPCVDCDERRIPVLDFDHVRGEKDTEISVLIGGGYGVDRIKAEIEKCEVRCANCHRMRHALERGTYDGLLTTDLCSVRL